MLEGVSVALGVTGSIAAVKVVELAHELRRQGAEVRGVVSPAATDIVHPWSVEFATEHEVVTELTGAVEHIELCGVDGWADVLLVAPATANTIGKMAAAIDDTPVTTCATTAIGAGLPVVVAPAMHEPMSDHPGVIEAIERLESWDVAFVDPVFEEGKAKLATEEAIVLGTARAVDDRPLAGRRIVVTSGSTHEAIDPLRELTNRASGKTGRAVARALYVGGADVTLIHDEGAVPYADTRTIETAAELADVTRTEAAEADALVSAAAIADYTVERATDKIRSGQDISLDLRSTPKLVDAIHEAHPDLPLVGFKAETSGDDDAMADAARELQARIDATFVVANDASVMGADDTRVLFVDGESVEAFSGTKQAVGFEVADRLASALAG